MTRSEERKIFKPIASLNFLFNKLRAYPKTSSFGPMLRSRSFSILEIGPLFLRLKKRRGLAWNQNLRFSDRL
jgi:hypothetical protein